MSNYNLQVTWSGKDALSDSDPDKVISGSDFNTEFTAVKTAVNSKADLNGSASETFSAVTAAAGTNTTQVATTAFTTTALALKANLASPTFTGVPAAPTAAVDTSTTQVATTAFTKAQIADTFSYASGVLTITTT